MEESKPTEQEIQTPAILDSVTALAQSKRKITEAMVNLRFKELFELDEQLADYGSIDAAMHSLMMWDTLIDVAEKRRAKTVEMLLGFEEFPRESLLFVPSSSDCYQPSNEVHRDSLAGRFLSLPYGDPEYHFEWAKIMKGARLENDRTHPRVVIVIDGQNVTVSSELPLEYLVVQTINYKGADFQVVAGRDVGDI